LERESKLYVVPETTNVDNAIELVGALDSEPAGAAIAGGWAAIEALLTGPGDEERGVGGDRLAYLVAASFPRAELTMLAYTYANIAKDALAGELRVAGSNLERSTLLGSAIQTDPGPNFHSRSDQLAVRRIRALLADPHAVMNDVNTHARTALRRLYRHRNLVLHWGRTNAICLRAALRTAAPLVGAGIDRIAHAWFTDKTEPLDLAARASLGLELVGKPGGPDAIRILD
jgi:hypothetical protein